MLLPRCRSLDARGGEGSIVYGYKELRPHCLLLALLVARRTAALPSPWSDRLRRWLSSIAYLGV